jgi:uncharacterized YccA/Bax inhibitor family protein
MRSGNPALKSSIFEKAVGTATSGNTMTIQGTVNKTGLMLLLIVGAAGFTWGNPSGGWLMLGLIGSIIAALVTIFKKELSMYSAPAYAVFEGLLLGGISYMFEQSYPGIVQQAILLTFGTLGALLLAYKSGMIKVTENFKLGVVAATGGVALTYLLGFIFSFFGVNFSIFGGGTIGIIFSLVVVVIASLNLVLDFDFIEEASERNLPKYFEWYGAFGLIVTLVWLYLELLRLLAKLRD